MMPANRVPKAVLVGLFLVLAAMGQDAPDRGFWYPGFRPEENPFQKAGRQYWVAPDGNDGAPGTREKPWKTPSGGRTLPPLPGIQIFF